MDLSQPSSNEYSDKQKKTLPFFSVLIAVRYWLIGSSMSDCGESCITERKSFFKKKTRYRLWKSIQDI